MILVIGASGNIGKYTVEKLNKLGHSVNIGTRNVDTNKSILSNNIYKYFDFLDQDTYDEALREVDTVFFIRPPKIGNPRDIYPFIDKMIENNIKHVVFVSLMGIEKNPIAPHSKIEKYIKNSKLNYTFLRPGFFMENLIYPHGNDIKEYNKIIIPAGNAKTSFIAAKDIGEAAAICIHEGKKHYKKAYTLTGETAYNYSEVASIMSNILNKKIIYTNPNIIKYRNHMIREGFDKTYVRVTTLLYIMTRLGTAKAIHHDLNRLIKRKPTTLKDFIKTNKHIWQKKD